MTMDPTTLVTFLFKAPPEARVVELLGSWDDFTQPYPMHHDRRRGTGYWSGCFKFQNIIFDGDSTYWTKPRTGGLKQGGTYWYYYRLNDQVEAYDDSQNSTTTCPLLPGQTVNIIEVPIEIVETPARCRSACHDVPGLAADVQSQHTLDPGHKFAALNPPPKSKVHGRCVSDLQLNGRLETKAQMYRSSVESRPSTSYSEPEQSDWSLDTPSHRYYSDPDHTHDPYSDYRSSLYSRRSWKSAAPSIAHSSIADAYGADCTAFAVDLWKALPPVPEAAISTADPAKKLASKEEGEARDIDFDSEIELTSPVDQSSLDGSDLETLFNPAPPSAWDRQPTRPTTSYSGNSWPPIELTQATEDPPASPTTHDRTSSEPEISPRHSTEQRIEVEGETFDILSPSFSAATLSTGGVNTPFRLSAACAPASANASAANDPSIESVAEKLRFLSSTSSDYEHEGSIPPVSEKDGPPSFFTAYALPLPDSTQSAQSMSKSDRVSSSSRARDSVVFAHDSAPLPSLFMHLHQGMETGSRRGSSFADDVFGELGFSLGGF